MVHMTLKLVFTRVVLLIFLMAFGRAAMAADISDIGISVHDNQTRLFIRIGSEQSPKVFTIGGGKPRIVVDLAKANLSADALQKTGGNNYFTGEGAISKLRFAQQEQNGLRFVADLKPDSKYMSHNYEDGVLTVLILGRAIGQTFVRISDDGTPIPRLKPDISINSGINDSIPVPRLKASRRTKAVKKAVKKPVIVIDPGHGGHDPGAIGSAKVHEETVTLKAALELRRQLRASGKYKVVMTRSTDKYIDHDKRVLIARKAGADLFISIHADATASATTRGASVYTLASRAEARTHKVVSQQNWVLDVDLTRKSAPVSNILVDLAQRKTLTKSGQFADILIPELKKQTRMVGNSHRRAGYYVLLAPDVPAVLLEMGFISNAQDEKLLKSTTHRKKLMKSVVVAINKYFNVQTRLQ